ncbi:MAG: hypothetical protein RAK24_01755 [TACK group archaeon]|nr:hypothetical protein [TACK group archaeon]
MTADPLRDVLPLFFKSMDEIEQTVKKIRELDSLQRSGSVEQSAAKRLREEYMSSLLKQTESFLSVERQLEDLRTKLKVEAQQLERKGREPGEAGKKVQAIEESYLNLDPKVWVEIAVSTLAIALLAHERGDLDDARLAEMREAYKRFLDTMAEKWNYQKGKLESVRNKLEEEIKSKQEKLEELSVRYEVGEYDRQTYEQLSLPLKQEVDDSRSRLEAAERYEEAVDSAVFTCYYAYTHPERGDADLAGIMAEFSVPGWQEVSDLLSPGASSTEMYEKLLNYYSLNMGADRAKKRLEAQIASVMSSGASRAEAIRSVYAREMGEGP